MKNSFRPAFLLLTLLAPTLVSSISGHESTLRAYESAIQETPDSSRTSPCAMDDAASCAVTVSLQDLDTGEPLPGLIRIRAESGCHIPLDPLFSRGTKLASDHEAQSWYAVLEPTRISVPRSVITIEAFSGLETEITRQTLDFTDRCSGKIIVTLKRFYDAQESSWFSGNTHLHIRDLSRQDSDRYLTTIPKADDIDLVFVSYLERVIDDRTYISNEYRSSDMEALSSPGLRFGWGEEFRHYFGRGGEGYGHVLLLNLQRLVRPVSIGPGLTGQGDDGIALRPGMAEARAQGGSVIWCHNTFGFEDIPSWLSGILDAQNIFDGGSEGSYEDSFYRYLNLGLHVPFSTGTDWFMYDFSRVYVHAPEKPSVGNWLKALSAGRSYITNGTFLEFTVDSKIPGDVLRLQGPARLPIHASAFGRNDFTGLELVKNGQVIARVQSSLAETRYVATLKTELSIDEPGWLAVRIIGGAKNEMGAELFAHTSPIYLEISGQRIFDKATAGTLIQDLEQAIGIIPTKAVFTRPAQWEQMRQIYEQGIHYLQDRLRTGNQ